MPVRLTLSVAKLATPFTAAIVVLPASTPPEGLEPSATVTLPVKLVTVFPSSSRTTTWTAGASAVPATALLGWIVKTSRWAVAEVMVKAALVAATRSGLAAVAVRVYPVPAELMLRSAKVVNPFTAATVVAPARTPPVGLALSATVMVPVKLGTVLPNASWAITWSAGLMATPPAAVLGWPGKASRVAPAGALGGAGPAGPGGLGAA